MPPTRVAFDVTPSARLIRVEPIQAIKHAEESLHQAEVHGSTTAPPAPQTTQSSSAGTVTTTVAFNSSAGVNKTLGCYQAVQANTLKPGATCPAECPLWAKDTLGNQGCTFKCVASTDCGQPGTNVLLSQSVPDLTKGTCRVCNITGCELCQFGKDVCIRCDKGSTLIKGKCMSNSAFYWNSILAVLGIIVLYVVLWYCNLLCCRANVNPEAVQEGLQFRSRTKLRMALQTGDGHEISRPLYPLNTNLSTQPVGGPGTTLFFRFQAVLIIWSLVVTVLWVAVAGSCDTELLFVGWRTYSTPLQLCRVMDMGFTVQERSANVKVGFLAAVYTLSFIGCIIFAVCQLRCFQKLDDESTMKDFVAFCEGVPRGLPGTEPLEDLLAQTFKASLHQDVVGVSVCWNYSRKEKDVHRSLAAALEGHASGSDDKGKGEGSAAQASVAAQPEAEAAASEQVAAALLQAPPRRLWRDRFFGKLERFWLQKVLDLDVKEEDEPPPSQAEDVEMVRGCTSAGQAFVVFHTEEARDAALDAANRAGGVAFQGASLRLRKVDAEPSEVRWHDCSIDRNDILKRTIFWVAVVFLGFGLFVVCLYLPYALWVTSFSYDSGNDPPPEGAALLTLIVVAGNLATFLLSDFAAEKIGYLFESERMATYMILYCGAVFLQVFLDMIVSSKVSYTKMVSEGAHTYGGKPIAELDSVQKIFESFPIQQTIGSQLFWYMFPACFLLPFLAEPFGTIMAPFHISKLLVQSHPEVKGHLAEKALKIFNPMDNSRYADVLVNLFLAVLIFWVPGGFTLPVIGGLLVSHIYIYCMDHYRVLRCVSRFSSASSATDKQAQRMLSVPCGLILSCIIFKQNCSNSAGSFCLDGKWLGILCFDVFLLHILVHLAVLHWVVPIFGLKEHKRASMDYAQVNAKFAASWFSTNPMHCLRSQYFYNQSPPCSFLMEGKEYLMVKNPSIGCHFEEQLFKSEEFN